jgi:putative PIG3 family NAD(P)H quinone oxidoreductase
MKAVIAKDASGTLAVVERPDPVPGPGEVVIDVAASAVNRADLLQALGRHPPPDGAGDVLGLEAAGVVVEVGDGVAEPTVGQRVMALLAAGGYAERVSVPAGQTMRVPPELTLWQAAAIPEAFVTAWRALVHLAPTREGDWVLVHAAASGVGLAAIQIARELGARVLGTVRSQSKLAQIERLGAAGVLAGEEGFRNEVLARTEGHGVDVVVDLIGASSWPDTIGCLSEGARLALVGLLGGARVELDLGRVMALQASIAGGTLRSRPPGEKASLVRGFAGWGLPRLGDGRLHPVVAHTLPLSAVQEAHALVASNAPAGKVVLITPGSQGASPPEWRPL